MACMSVQHQAVQVAESWTPVKRHVLFCSRCGYYWVTSVATKQKISIRIVRQKQVRLCDVCYRECLLVKNLITATHHPYNMILWRTVYSNWASFKCKLCENNIDLRHKLSKHPYPRVPVRTYICDKLLLTSLCYNCFPESCMALVQY